MKCWKGHFLNALVCPFCEGKLIKYHHFLVCRFHKLGFLVHDMNVDFRLDRAQRFTLEEIKKIH